MSEIVFERLMAELPKLPQGSGILMTDILGFPEDTRQFINWLLRKRGAEPEEIAHYLQTTLRAVHTLLEGLAEQGIIEFVEIDGNGYYRVRMRSPHALHRPPQTDLWKVVDDTSEK